MTQEQRELRADMQEYANKAKNVLMTIAMELEQAGLSKDADELDAMIIKLEKWQNK